MTEAVTVNSPSQEDWDDVVDCSADLYILLNRARFKFVVSSNHERSQQMTQGGTEFFLL